MNLKEQNVQKLEFTKKISPKKLSVIITIVYFIIFSYIAFYHHPFWFEPEGIMYLNWGNDLIFGNASDVYIPDSPVGWPIIHSILSYYLGDAFVIGKMVALLSATGIIFTSFYVIRNVFGDKIALVGQLFFVVNPRLNVLSVEAMNELLPILLIMISFYFITKKTWNSKDLIISGLLLGISATIRFQAILVMIPALIFLLIRRKPIILNLKYCTIFLILFIIGLSPLMIYNSLTFDNILETDSSQYMIWFMKYQTPEWREQMIQMELSGEGGLLKTIALDPQLFFKNYFFNLFFHNSSHLFNFNTFSNMSIISLIPYVSIIPIIGGLSYILKINKNDLKIIFISLVISIIGILTIGDFSKHFFILILIPFIPIFLKKIRKIDEKIAFFLILAVIYLIIISIVPLKGPYQLLPMWITVVLLSSIFLVETLPKILNRIKNCNKNCSRNITIITIASIIILQIGFSYKLLDTVLYDWDRVFEKDVQKINLERIMNELTNSLSTDKKRTPSGITYYEIGKELAKQPDIENSYIMAKFPAYSYYAGSKYIHTHLQEGTKDGTIMDFVTRENWTDIDKYNSNMFSNPNNRHNTINFTPDYFIFEEQQPGQIHRLRGDTTQLNNLTILLDPKNRDIPTNFEFLFKSNYTNTVVYKINPLK